jgi:multidrug efflux system outer membrane protein
LNGIGSLTQPLFNKGMNITNLKIAESKQEQSTSQLRQSLLDAEKEVNDPLVQCQTSKQQIEFGKQKISILNETVHKTEF